MRYQNCPVLLLIEKFSQNIGIEVVVQGAGFPSALGLCAAVLENQNRFEVPAKLLPLKCLYTLFSASTYFVPPMVSKCPRLDMRHIGCFECLDFLLIELNVKSRNGFLNVLHGSRSHDWRGNVGL